jgi:hypothetical protein
VIAGAQIEVCVQDDPNEITNNRIGTSADGTADLGYGDGVDLMREAPGTLLRDNLISGNAYEGLQLETGDDAPYEENNPAVGNRVLGNLIGTDQSGETPLGNGSTYGLQALVLSGANAGTIGGHEPGAANVIAANAGTRRRPTCTRPRSSRRAGW